MRPSPITPLALLALLAGACAPRGDDATADTTLATMPAADSASAAVRDTLAPDTSAGATATPTAPRSSSRTSAPATDTAARATDTSRRGTMKAPTKAPGGYIVLPPRVRDSLRMAPPTSTRP
jgi:hypothetical protein